MSTTITVPIPAEQQPEISCDKCGKIIAPGDWYYTWRVAHGSRTTYHTLCRPCERRLPRIDLKSRPDPIQRPE